jgi:hypothetical protein
MGAMFPHLGAMCDHTGAACTIWKPYGVDRWDPRASVEVKSHGYIGFYSGAMRATFGSTVAKECRCGACRRLVSVPHMRNSNFPARGARSTVKNE